MFETQACEPLDASEPLDATTDGLSGQPIHPGTTTLALRHALIITNSNYEASNPSRPFLKSIGSVFHGS